MRAQDTTLKVFEPHLEDSEEAIEQRMFDEDTTTDSHPDASDGPPVPEVAILDKNPPLHNLASYSISDKMAKLKSQSKGGAAAAQVTAPRVTSAVDDGHCSAINSVVACLDFLCSAGGDCTVRVWKKETLAPVTTLRGHRGPVMSLVAIGARPDSYCSGYAEVTAMQ